MVNLLSTKKCPKQQHQFCKKEKNVKDEQQYPRFAKHDQNVAARHGKPELASPASASAAPPKSAAALAA
jgi:hypothetical protein